MVETPQANLMAGMRWFQTTYTVRFNRRHRVSGHLFQGRYKAVVVDPEERGYFATLSDYIHRNPVRAGMVGPAERLYDYAWSSYPFYVARKERPAWFRPDEVLGELGLADTGAGRRQYAERMRRRAVEELGRGSESAELRELRRGWCLGSASFRERMLRLLDAAAEKFSPLRRSRRDAIVQRDHGLDGAQHLLEEGLRQFGLKLEDLPALKKSDPRKAALAAFIRPRTAVSNEWIAQTLHLGHVSRVGYCVRRASPELMEQLSAVGFAEAGARL